MKLPIIDNQVALTGDADAASDVSLSSLRLENSATPKVRATTVSGPYQANGLSYDATGRLFYVDATAGLPAGTTYAGGLPFNSSGALCVSSDAASTWVNGVPFAANGAVSSSFAVASSLPQSGNIVFNMQADSLSLADGATVSSWTDSTANALAFTGTGTYRTNQLGGKPCVSFSGAAGQLMTATRAGTALDTAMSSQICTTMIVGKSRGANSLGCMFGSTAGGNSMFMVLDGAQASSNIGRYNGGTLLNAPGVNAANMFVMASTSIIPYAISSGTGFEQTYLNGSCVSSNVAPAPAPSQTTFSIGGASAGSLRAAVDLFDIVVWDRRLTPTEVFQATNYFYDKYSQTKPWAAVSAITLFDGNSITAGVGTGSTAGSYPYKSAQSLGLSYGQWSNLGVGGITVTNMQGKLADWSGIGALLGKNMNVAAFEYYNQRGNGATAIQNADNAYAAAVRALPNTKLVWGTSTSHSGDPDATRIAVDAYYDANFASMCDSYVPLHNNTFIGDTAAYATYSATYWSDTVHLNAAGATILASLMTAGVQALP